ncbi:MAG TPA: VWA domain-containing protein [Silvibacterium sp.]|nr:VWA domain-containing protein [Silvibacterium sp.]
MLISRISRSLCLLLCPAIALAQTANTSTIQVTSRIVYVDVVVHDGSGHLVHGLTQKDFQVWEDGKPQQVDYFVAHSYDLAGPHPLPAPPPKNEYSNVPMSGAGGAVNMILFDLVNTDPQSQQYARKQMLSFLKALPPGQQIALFVLSDQLHMFQSFTGSSDLLAAAAKLINPTNMRLLQSDAEQQRDIDTLGRMQDALGGRDAGGSIQHLADLMMEENEQTAEIRQRITLSAFAEIAHAAAGYPGRKNLYWLSGSFPFSVTMQSQYNITGPVQFSTLNNPTLPISDVNAVQDAAKLVANSQIAVYPISAVGLDTGGVGVDVSGGSMAAMSGTSGQGNNAGLGTGSVKHTMGDTLAQQFVNRSTLHGAMEDIAYQTGGEAVFGSNDLAGALRRTMEDGSNYYTLAYRPQNHDWNGAFRKIKVALAQRGYSLTYRRGYFAFANQTGNENTAQELNAALQPGAPQSTLLLIRSTVTPPDAQNPFVLVDTTVEPAGIEFTTDAAGVRHAKLLVLLVALTDSVDGKPEVQPDNPPQTSGALHLDFTPEQYASILKTGIRFGLKLPLKPGSYQMRLGVSDVNNHRLGTLNMPVTIGAVPPS